VSPEKWVPVLQELGYETVEKLGEVEKYTKLHQEMMGFRKKNKLEIRTVTPDEVRDWLEKLCHRHPYGISYRLIC